MGFSITEYIAGDIVLNKVLAVKLGYKKATALSEIHRHIDALYSQGHINTFDHDGRKWLTISIPAWQKEVFPYWSPKQVGRILRSLCEPFTPTPAQVAEGRIAHGPFLTAHHFYRECEEGFGGKDNRLSYSINRD